MNKELTEIVLVVDRSGSMGSCAEEAQNGINQLIEEQKGVEGKANFTLVQFDNEYEFVHEGVSIKDVPDFTLKPRGMTALLDAVGRSITETGTRLENMDEKDRPALVTFVIVTDGAENASQEFKLKTVQDMIKEQQEKYNWQFTFLGANADAFAGGVNLGIKSPGLALYASDKSDIAFSCSSANLTRQRGAVLCGAEVTNEYTAEELKSMA